MNITRMRVLAPALAFVAASCGTTMTVNQGRRDATGDPDGLVINNRTVMAGTVSSVGLLPFKTENLRFVAVDPVNVLVVNIERDAFASGKLELKLDDKQQILEAGITSKAGAPGVVGVLKTGIESRNTIAADEDDDS